MEEEIKNIVDTICNVRNGSMDEKQFRATVEHNIDLAVSKERERIVGEVKKRSSFFKTIVSEWGDIYIDIVKGITEDDIINLINTK